jgi:hypothetical protein
VQRRRGGRTLRTQGGAEFVFHITPPFQGSRTIRGMDGDRSELLQVQGASTDAIRSALFRPDRISFKGGKEQWGYTLDEPQQTRVAAAFVVGNTYYCADAPGRRIASTSSCAAEDAGAAVLRLAVTMVASLCAVPRLEGAVGLQKGGKRIGCFASMVLR